MTRQCPALIDVLAEIPDFRQAQGRRYALPAVLALAVAATLHTIFRHVDKAEVEAKLSCWVEGVMRITAEEIEEQAFDALNLDGKSLRGSRKQGAPGGRICSRHSVSV